MFQNVTYCSRGQIEGLRLAACTTADTTDSSILCAAQMEEIDRSKEAGSSMSAGTRFFKSSIVIVGSEVEVVGRAVNVGSGSTDAWRGGGVLNLIVVLVYGRGRLNEEAIRTRSRC